MTDQRQQRRTDVEAIGDLMRRFRLRWRGHVEGMSHANRDVLLYGLFIHIATTLAFFAMHSREIVALTPPGNHVDMLYPLKITPLPGYWDAAHDRPRTRNTRPRLVMNNVLIFY